MRKSEAEKTKNLPRLPRWWKKWYGSPPRSLSSNPLVLSPAHTSCLRAPARLPDEDRLAAQSATWETVDSLWVTLQSFQHQEERRKEQSRRGGGTHTHSHTLTYTHSHTCARALTHSRTHSHFYGTSLDSRERASGFVCVCVKMCTRACVYLLVSSSDTLIFHPLLGQKKPASWEV